MSNNYEPVIPVDIEFNAFTIQRFLAALRSPSERAEIVSEWGSSAESRKRYEEEHDLPEGSFEVALLFNDPDFLNAVRQINQDYQSATSKDEALKKASEDSSKLVAQSNLKYPRAVRFLMEYQALVTESYNRAIAYGDSLSPDITYPYTSTNVVLGVTILVVVFAFAGLALGVVSLVIVVVTIGSAGIGDYEDDLC